MHITDIPRITRSRLFRLGRCAFMLAGAAGTALGTAFGTANYVYHERSLADATAGNPGSCAGAQSYLSVLSPSSSQTVTVRFKVEYQFFTDRVRVYYTTNGSNPDGLFGTGVVGTFVLDGSYDCTFTQSGNTIDIASATIPAQPAGTVVKYIISAYHSGGGDEIFANSGSCFGCGNFTTAAQATVFSYTVGEAPTITTPPADLAVCAGASAMLSVAASGSAPLGYQWSLGGSELPGATSATLSIPNAQAANAGSYTVVVSNQFGTVTSAAAILTVNPLPTVSVNSATICIGGSAMLTATTSAANPTYLWSPGGETTASITVSPASTTVYSVTVTDGVTTCSADASGTVTVNPLPTASVNSETICAGGSAMLTATTAAANPTYLWAPGGETTASITVSPASTAVYSVTVTDGVTTCSAGASGTVTVNPLPAVSVNSETICAGGSTMLTATTAAANPTYLWAPGGETTASITVSPASTTVYSVTVTDGVTTCSAGASGTVTVNPLPTVSVNSEAICIGGSAMLTATTSAANPTYLWAPGGETTASITVSPASTTVYSVTVTDGVTTCAAGASGTVTVNPLPTVSVNSTTICAGGSAMLTATTSAANPTYLWAPGGETTASITVSPASTTVYSVTVTDGVTTCSAGASGTVTVNPLPTASVNSETICAGGSAMLTATTAAANPSYLWSPGGETTASITVSPASTTVYSVTVTDGVTTCSAGASGTVTVNPLPAVSVNSATICVGDSATLTATTSAANPTYLWSPGGETTASITVSPASTTVYSVTVTDGVTTCSAGASGTVTVRLADVFANAAVVTINDSGAAAPYPSAISVSGLTAAVCKVTVTLTGLGHTFPSDIDMLLVAPNGQTVLLMSDAGNGNPISGVDLTFDDAAAGSLVESGALVTGTFKPTNHGNKVDSFPAPAPAGAYAATLASLSGINPNGTWSLYITDDESIDAGTLAGGWSLGITTLTPIADLAVSQTTVPEPLAVGSNVTITVTVTNRGPAAASSVVLADTLPAGVTFVSASSDIGSCSENLGVVTCNIGSLLANSAAQVTINLTGATAGGSANSATVSSATVDLVAGNNTSSAPVTVIQPVVITVGLANQAVCAGGNATLAVTVTGAAPIPYQWFKDAVLIPTATTETLTVSGAQVTDSGTYSVVVANAASAAGSSAVLTVNPLPTVTVNSETICAGASAVLTATTSAANPTYLWSPGGATTPSITVSPASTTVYSVIVTDGVTTCSAGASGTVTVNDLTTAAALTSIANLCPGLPASFTTTAAGTGPHTFVWRKDGNLLAETSATLSIAAVTAEDAGTYSVEVSGICNTVTNSATLTVVAAPVISAHPINQTTPMGNGAVFSVTATGVAPVTYQWQTNGVNVTGATATSFAISNLSLAMSGAQVRVVVSTCGGNTTSLAANLEVTPISGISFDFDTPGQYTNAPYYLTYNNWINGGYLPGTLGAPTVFESPIGGTGPSPGSGSLDMAPNQGTESTSILLPVNFDFSLTGKTVYASTMFKVKTPITAGRRATQFGFVTATNSGINDVAGQAFTTVIVQDTTAGTPAFELRTQRRASGGGLQESVVVPAATLTVSNWYKLNITLINTKSTANPTNFTITASLQDMGPLGTTPGVTNMSFTTTTNGSDMVNFKNIYLALRSFEDGGMEARDNTYAWTTPGNIFFVQQPQNATVSQGQRAVFRALVDGEGPYTYQWYRNGVAIAGARSWNYIVPPTVTSDNGAQYSVDVTGPANTITSGAATLTVTPQTLAVVSAGSVDGTTVGVLFNQPVATATAENVANYSINGSTPVQARVYRTSVGPQGPDGIYVVLTPGTPIAGAFTVTVSGVQDLSGGAVGAANSAAGTVAGLTGSDVNPGITGPAGENYSFGPGQFIVTGAGVDIFSGGDSFRYVYTTQTGDFDLTVRVPYMDTVRFTAKAGIDARFTLNPFSPGVLMAFDPGPMAEGSGTLRQFTEGTTKMTWGAGGTSWGNASRLFHPDVWMRFRRTGNNFMRYSSTNGINWVLDGQTQPFTNYPPQQTMYLGLAVCSARNMVPMTALFQNYGNFAGYPGATIVVQSQPTNITVAAGSAATIGGLVATASGGGIPAGGEIAYLWQRSDGAGGWTNMPTAGVTNSVLTFGNVFNTDNGAQYRAIVMAPGAAPVTSGVATLTVTDSAVPTISSVNGSVIPSYQVSEVVLNFSEPLTDASALNLANYTVTNAAGVRLTVLSAAFLGTDTRTVILKVDGTLGSGTASVGVSGLRDLNNNLLASTTRTYRSFLPSTAPVVIEVYQDIAAGTTIPDLTGNAIYTAGTPTFITYSNLFGFNVSQTGIQDNYGVKAYTYFVPPTNGAYKFWIRGDDAMELYMNTNITGSTTDPNGKVLIASLTAFSANYVVGTAPANSRTNITLTGGQPYYMEFLGKEGTGGDGFSVMWTAPSVNTAPTATTFIPTANLAYPTVAAPATPVVMDIYTGYQNFLAGFNQLAGLYSATNFPPDNYAINVVNFKYIAGLADVIGYQKYFGVQPTTLGNTRLDNYLGRLQSYFIAPSNGLYRFWAAVDDVCQLYMNTNAVNSTDPAGMVLLGQSANAYVSAASQLMAQNVPLVGGQKYYLMALWREGGSGDGIRVSVRSQGDSSTPPTTEVIPASMLEYPTAVGRAGAVNLMAIAPTNPTVIDGRPLVLSAAGISGAPPYGGFIWLKNGVRVMENSFTNYTPPLTLADNGSVYTLIVTNLFSRSERSVTVTVLPDGAAPTVVRTLGRRYNDGFTIVYSEPVDRATATYLGNYQVTGGLALRSATLDPTRTMVSFETAGQTSDTTYVITINGVRDASSSGNLIAPNTTTSFSTWSVGGSGFMVELFTNIQGAAIADLTGTVKYSANLPDVVYYTNVFGVGAFAANSGLENYGARITGYFIPTNTGYYRFFVRSDDASQFLMNINNADSENPAGKTLLVHMPNANVNINDARSISPPVQLNQGQKYYVESLLKEGGGGDYMQVTFRPSDALGALAANPTDNTVNENSTITMFGGAGAPGNPDVIQITQTPPSDVFVTENDLVTLSLVANVPANVVRAASFTWQKWDGASYTNIPGGNGQTLAFYANLVDDMSTVRVIFSAPGKTVSYTTILHVSPDSQTPYFTAASSLDGYSVDVCFNERIETLVLGDNFNYIVNGGAVGVVAVQPRADSRSAKLLLDFPVSGDFTVEAQNMQDLATSPNISLSISTNGYVQGFSPFDVGAPPGPGSSFSCVPGEIDVIAGGADIWGTSDQGHLTLTPRTGDFDIWLRVKSVTRAAGDNDLISKAGLMIRETAAADSRKLHVLLEPPLPGAREFYEAGQRPTTAAATAAWAGGVATGFGPAGMPNGWARIKRVGDTFFAYRSTNGTDWTLVTTNNMTLPQTVLVGLGATAHVPSPSASTVFAEFRDIHIPNPPVFVTQPASSIIAVGGSATLSATVTNVPNGGPLTLQWLKDGLVLLGETADTLTLSSALAAQSGSYMLRAGNDGGWSFSTAAVIVVSNGLPVVAGETLTATQNVAFTISGASLLANDSDPEGAPLSILGVNGVCSTLASSGFEFGVPAGASIHGNAAVRPNGGAGNSSMLRLTDGIINQFGAILFDDMGAGAPMAAFTASFKLKISDVSGEPADGFSFNFASDLGTPAYAAVENGVGTGLSLCVDNYRFAPYPAGGTANTSGMKIRYGGVDIGGIQAPTWNSPDFIPVTITLKLGGLLTVTVNGTNLVTDLAVPYAPAAGRFGIYARTGGQFESHTIDDVVIRPTYLTPGGGLVTYDSGTGDVTYTPATGYCGPDSFVYLVSDGQQGGVSCGVVNLMVKEAIEIAPVITTCPTNRTIAVAANCQAAIPSMVGELVVTENCTYLVATQNPPAGTLVGPGNTVVTFTVTDSAGLTATCNATVTVVDQTAPQITSCAPPVVIPAGLACTALVPDLTGLVVATDDCSAVIVTQEPAAGTVIPTGITSVLLIATDAAGNTNLCSTTVSVVDAAAPTVNCPADITVSCSDTNGATVTFTASAVDNCDATPIVTATPASGSVFAVGTNVVTVTAVDAAGNTNTCSFKVIVNDPVQPTLSISHVGSDVVITWPQTCTPYVLEETTNLNEPITWAPATGTITAVGADYQITLPASEGNKYFRLKKP